MRHFVRSPFLVALTSAVLGLSVTTFSAHADTQPYPDQICETFDDCPRWREDDADPCPTIAPTDAVQTPVGSLLPVNLPLRKSTETPPPSPDDFIAAPFVTLQDPITVDGSTKIPVVISWRTLGSPTQPTPPAAPEPRQWKVLYTSATSPSFDVTTAKQTTCDTSDKEKHVPPTTISNGVEHAARLKLDPDTRYYYRAVSCTPGTMNGPKYLDGTFRTPPLLGAVPQHVKLAHFGEIHAGNSTSPAIVPGFTQPMRDFAPDFIVESGDMINTVDYDNFKEYL